jgi:hypothetical protein
VPGFNDNYANGWVLRQAVCKHATGGTGADDEVITGRGNSHESTAAQQR